MTGSNPTNSSGQAGSSTPSTKNTGPNTSSNKANPNTGTTSNKPPGTPAKPTPPSGTPQKPNTTAPATPQKPNTTAPATPQKPNTTAPATAANTSPPRNNAVKRSPSPGNTGARLPGPPFLSGMVAMRLFTREGKFPEVPDEAVKEKPGPLLDAASKTVMAHCFHVALALLENSTGHDAFVKVAQNIVTRRRAAVTTKNPKEEGLFANKDIKEMPKYVNEFLHKVRTIGIPVCVTAGVKGIYGQTQRWTWGYDMAEYDPAKAAVIYLNKGMVQGLLDAADAVEDCMRKRSKINEQIQKKQKKADDPAVKKELQDLVNSQRYASTSFERGVFCLSATLAHELVHCLTGYLTGRAAINTPPGPAPYGPYDNAKRGEAGWEWCKLAFGGLAHFWYTKGSPHPLTSGFHLGIPLLLDVAPQDDWQKTSKFYMIDHDIVKKIIEMKDWADAYKADRNWMHKIRKQGDPGVLYPEWKAKHNEVVRIWNHNNAISDVNSGSAFAMAKDTDIAYAAALKSDVSITKALVPADLKAVKA